MTTKIKNLTLDDDGMWSWMVIDDDEYNLVKMRTNDGAEGMWELVPSNSWTIDAEGDRHPNYIWQQQCGTGQFSLCGCSHSGARSRILHALG